MSSNALHRMQSLGRQGSLAEAVQPKEGFVAFLWSTVRRWLASTRGASIKLVLYLLGCILVSPIILTPLFICLKIDGTVDWSWATTTIILWILDGIFFVLLIAGMLASSEKKDKSTHPILGFLCQLLAQIFIVLRLDNHTSWSWSVIFIPFYVGYAVDYSASSFLQLLQIIFLGLKLDGTVTWKWEVVFIPTWIPIAFIMVIVPLGIILFSCFSDDAMSPLSAIFSSLGLMILFGLISAPSVLIVVRQYYTFSTLYIALPYFILMGLIFIAGILCIFFADFSEEDKADNYEACEA